MNEEINSKVLPVKQKRYKYLIIGICIYLEIEKICIQRNGLNIEKRRTSKETKRSLKGQNLILLAGKMDLNVERMHEHKISTLIKFHFCFSIHSRPTHGPHHTTHLHDEHNAIRAPSAPVQSTDATSEASRRSVLQNSTSSFEC